MKIVTSGARCLDIDTYACIIAYTELLELQGDEAVAFSTAPLDESISATIRSWSTSLNKDYTPTEDDTYILVDISEPDLISKTIDLTKVIEVIDHHPGFEEYWQNRIGNKSHIEFIGAACTLIYERWELSGLVDKISVLSARLLMCGILDNTLNFNAKVTTARDRQAYDKLIVKAELPKDWTTRYFNECQATIIEDAISAIQNDTKNVTVQSFSRIVSFSQLVVWNGKHILDNHQEQAIATLSSVNINWLLNLVSIKENKSYFITDNNDIQVWLQALIDIKFIGSIATADRLWLRKEITKQDITNE